MQTTQDTLDKLEHQMRDIVRSLEEVQRRIATVRDLVQVDYEFGTAKHRFTVLKELDTILEML